MQLTSTRLAYLTILYLVIPILWPIGLFFFFCTPPSPHLPNTMKCVEKAGIKSHHRCFSHKVICVIFFGWCCCLAVLYILFTLGSITEFPLPFFNTFYLFQILGILHYFDLSFPGFIQVGQYSFCCCLEIYWIIKMAEVKSANTWVNTTAYS